MTGRRHRGLRVLEVRRVEELTAHMRRLVLGGPERDGFGPDPNIKLLFPPASLTEPEWPRRGVTAAPSGLPPDAGGGAGLLGAPVRSGAG